MPNPADPQYLAAVQQLSGALQGGQSMAPHLAQLQQLYGVAPPQAPPQAPPTSAPAVTPQQANQILSTVPSPATDWSALATPGAVSSALPAAVEIERATQPSGYRANETELAMANLVDHYNRGLITGEQLAMGTQQLQQAVLGNLPRSPAPAQAKPAKGWSGVAPREAQIAMAPTAAGVKEGQKRDESLLRAATQDWRNISQGSPGEVGSMVETDEQFRIVRERYEKALAEARATLAALERRGK